MSGAIRHRGPDDSGVWTDHNHGVAFGFRRLSIIELSELGHQPMQSATGRYTLIFNGEIYNHNELRSELKAQGARFRGRSDTEVILAAFEEWNVTEAVRRFNGMFAIAVWDAVEERLRLVRDRLGIKPMFVHHGDGLFLFGSEIKALVAAPCFRDELDVDALAAFFRHLYIPAPHTIYRNTRKLLPGHILTIGAGDHELRASEPYWSLEEAALDGEAHPFEGSDSEAAAALEELLLSAVRPRMQADVPLGAFLSGGIDSSLVVSMMQSSSSRPVKTYSVGFEEEEYNEAHHASRIAAHLGTDHTEFTVTSDDARNLVPSMVEVFDEPFASASAIPNYLLCKLARSEVTVALAGTGGDEVFAGYNRYTYGERFLRSASRIPHGLRQVAAAGMRGLSSDGWSRMYDFGRKFVPGFPEQANVGGKAVKLANMLREESAEDMYRSLVSWWHDPQSLIRGCSERDGRLQNILSGSLPNAGWLRRIMLADQLTYLPDDQLNMVDRVSMAVGLELRVPILDHRVVEFAWKLPTSLLRREGEGKWLLRQVLHRSVPRHFVDRPKMGLSVPIEAWLRGPLREWAEEMLHPTRLETEGILNAAPIRSAWDDLQAGKGMALGLWSVIIFQAWKNRWLSS